MPHHDRCDAKKQGPCGIGLCLVPSTPPSCDGVCGPRRVQIRTDRPQNAIWLLGSNIVKEGHKSEIHVQLLVTVEQGQPWIVGDEIDRDLLITSDHHYIFHYCRSGCSRDVGQLEAVPVEVNWVNVIAGIAHLDSIPLA